MYKARSFSGLRARPLVVSTRKLLSSNLLGKFSYSFADKIQFFKMPAFIRGQSKQTLFLNVVKLFIPALFVEAYTDYALKAKTRDMFSYRNWYLRFSDEDESNLIMPTYSFNVEDDAFGWYARELELFTTFSKLTPYFRHRQLFNFQYGFKNIIGDFAFLSKEINYHSLFEHDYPDKDAPFFESEDDFISIPKATIFDTVSAADEEEFVEEDDIDYADQLIFEDGFLHADTEMVQFNGEDFEELMLDDGLIDQKKLKARAGEFRDFDLELDEAREDVFDMFTTQY